MNLRYLVLIITLKNINCYNPNRHTQTTSPNSFNNLKSKTTDPVIPARYKITSKTSYGDPTITQNFPAEYFPEVEYPESVADSSKPFYLSASPFPYDVQSTFNSFVGKGNSKAKTATDYSQTQNEKNKEKEPAAPQKVGENEITDIKGNEINVIDKGTIETLHDDISTLDVKNDIENEEIFIKDLDEVIKILTSTGTPECNEGNNNKVHTFESQCSNEFKLCSNMTPNNNDFIIELNGNSSLEEKQEVPERIRNPLFQDSDTNDALTSLTSLLNEYITNVTSVEDMQSDFCSIGLVANETNTSCTAS